MTGSRGMLALLVAVGAAYAEPRHKDAFPDARVEAPTLLAPTADAVVRTSELTVGIVVPPALQDAEIRVRLDGARVTPVDAIVTRGHTAVGRGARFLGSLSTARLAPGPHELRFVVVPADGPPVEVATTFTFRPYPCRVRFEIEDGAGAPLSARVAVLGPDGPVSLTGPKPAVLDPRYRDHELHSVFVHGGRGEARVPDGPVRFVATAGIRHDVMVVEAASCPTAPVRLRLPEVLPTPGVVTTDFHVHTPHSSDVFAPAAPMLRNLAASGVDLAVISDHNRIVDLSSLAAAVLGPEADPQLVPGIEAKLGPGGELGHLNAFPLDPAAAPFDDPDASVAAWIAGWRARQHDHPHAESGDQVVLQLNHPRGIQFHPDQELVRGAHALFTRKGFDPTQPLDAPGNRWLVQDRGGVAAVDFDAMEILNRFSWQGYKLVRRDWFALLNAGHRITGTGNSDTHALAVELVGMPVNLVSAARRPSGAVDLASLVASVHAGRVSVSTGPVVDVTVTTAAGRGTVGDTVVGHALTVHATVRAAPWVPVNELRLIVNGEVVESEALPAGRDVARAERTWTVTADRDSWLLVEAGWPLSDASTRSPRVGGRYGEVAPGYVPIGFTNPVWVDADGDGAWAPPRPLVLGR